MFFTPQEALPTQTSPSQKWDLCGPVSLPMISMRWVFLTRPKPYLCDIYHYHFLRVSYITFRKFKVIVKCCFLAVIRILQLVVFPTHVFWLFFCLKSGLDRVPRIIFMCGMIWTSLRSSTDQRSRWWKMPSTGSGSTVTCTTCMACMWWVWTQSWILKSFHYFGLLAAIILCSGISLGN